MLAGGLYIVLVSLKWLVLLWTVYFSFLISVNGIRKGTGTGSSKQLAKEAAAREAYYGMGWT